MNWYKRISDKPIKMLQLPERRQGSEYSCGAGVFGSVLGYYGIDIREGELKKALGTNPEVGTQQGDMVSVAKKLGLNAIRKRMELKEVIEWINRDVPVILLIQAWAEQPTDYKTTREYGHYVASIGYSKKGMYFEDPNLVINGFLTYQDLLERWRGGDEQEDRDAIVIYGKKPQFSENKAEPIE